MRKIHITSWTKPFLHFNNWQHLLTTQDVFHSGKADTLCELNAVDMTFVELSAVHWSISRVSDDSSTRWHMMPLSMTQHVTQMHGSSTVVGFISLLQHINLFQLHFRLWMVIVTNLQQ